MSYTVKQLANLAGITPRTLRHYDKVGLLSPASHGKNGYRYYEDEELNRLQQILFFKELEFPLKEIKRILSHPNFDPKDSLLYQKRLLTLKKKRLERIIKSIDKTILRMNNQQKPSNEDMYEGLSSEVIDEYKKEAKERWGGTDAYKQSQERVKNFTKDDWKTIKEEGRKNMEDLVALMLEGKEVTSAEVQKEVEVHYKGISRFYDCSMQMYHGLADMYLTDQRFADYYRKFHPELPEYLVAAIHAYCDAR